MLETKKLMEGLVMFGWPLAVDELSLGSMLSSLSMLFQCRFLECLKGMIHITINGEPYIIAVQQELGSRGGGAGGLIHLKRIYNF